MQNGISAARNPISMARESVVLVSSGRRVDSKQILPADALLLSSFDQQFSFLINEFGTGFVVNTAGQIVTCMHVVERAIKRPSEDNQLIVWQVNESNALFPHTIQYDNVVASKSHDIAVLTPQDGQALVPLSGGPARRRSGGQPVHYWGWFYSQERAALLMVLRNGILCPNVLPASEEMAARLLFEGVAVAGSSGSALVNFQGELVGMVNAVHTRPKEAVDVGEAVPVSAIYDVLNYAGIKLAWEE